MTGVRVAKSKKNPPSESGENEGAQAAQGEKLESPVKLRPSFKKRLQRVANAINVDMGELVEAQMKKFVDREIKRLAEEDLRSAPEE